MRGLDAVRRLADEESGGEVLVAFDFAPSLCILTRSAAVGFGSKQNAQFLQA